MMGIASLPIVVWAVHFTVIYGFTALACARHLTGAVPWVVGTASAAAMLALIALALPAGIRAAGIRATQAIRFPDCLALGLAALAAMAVVWEASSLLWVPACG